MSETPEPDEVRAGPPPPPGPAAESGSAPEPDGSTEILSDGAQPEAAEAPQPQSPDWAAPGTFAGQPWAPPATADLRTVTGPAPVLMSFAPPIRQRRLTVAFRGILVIPHWIIIGVLGFAAGVVAFIGWWAALFTGQLPDWAHEFLTGVLRWQARVFSYLELLTDEYPPFTLDDADYPIRLFTKQTRLNRLAVFFRIILAIPVYLLTAIMAFGMVLVGIVAWLITLITGRMPEGLHNAFAATIRFVVRYDGYLYLVTPEYPGGLYGDAPSVAGGWQAADTTAAAQPSVSEIFPTEAGTGEATVPDATVPDATVPDATGPDATGPEAPAAEATAPPAAATTADPWRLVLAGNAKTLVTVTMVVGLLGLGGYIGGIVAITGSAVNNVVQQTNAYNTVTADYNNLGTVVSSFQGKVSACNGSLSCVTKLDGQLATAFQDFGSGVQGAGIPSSFSGQVSTLLSANSSVTSDLNKLAGAQSASQYSSIGSSLNLQGDLNTWQSAFNNLSRNLKPKG